MDGFDWSWDGLANWGGGLIESAGEGIGDIFDGWVDSQVADQRANSRDPEVVNNAQIDQGKTTTGESVNHTVGDNANGGFVVNNTMLIAGGVVLLVLGTLVVVASRGK